MNRDPSSPYPRLPQRPILSMHALARMSERDVSFDAIRAVLAKPFALMPAGEFNCWVAAATVVTARRYAWLIVVINVVTGVVLTVYWHATGRPARLRAPKAVRRQRPLREEEASDDAA